MYFGGAKRGKELQSGWFPGLWHEHLDGDDEILNKTRRRRRKSEKDSVGGWGRDYIT